MIGRDGGVDTDCSSVRTCPITFQEWPLKKRSEWSSSVNVTCLSRKSQVASRQSADVDLLLTVRL